MKIDFKNIQINFWRAKLFSIKKKISVSTILEQAYNQRVLVDNNDKMLYEFIQYFNNLKIQFCSQIFQDIFASFLIKDRFDKTFLEFGATDGLNNSNTFLLERAFGWSGILAEPDIRWIDLLKKNRSNTKIITKCIWKKSDEKLNFFSSINSDLSTLEEFKFSDIETMPTNTQFRNESGNNITVETISLNDVIKKYFDEICPSYISIDTEGSEFEILNAFNFHKYRPVLFTIEHNYTKLEKIIDELMIRNDYTRIFNQLTAFDAWYISNEALKKI